jgi:hypothetical protein
MFTRSALALLVAAAPVLAGCPGHEARVENALDALNRGRPAEAVAELNAEMEVESSKELPDDLGGDNALLLLDRATVLQSLDRLTLSQRDFGAADKAIEVLDLSKNAAHDLGRYLFSDDVGPYRAPAFEKLLVNSFNMMNYLARGDLNGARVEARRLAVMQRYLEERQDTTSLVGLGSYLAGFTFEKSGKPSEALLYYEEALKYQDYPSLRDPLRRLTRGKPKSKRIDALVQGEALPPLSQTNEAELLVVVGYGRVPRKLPTRIPIGLALTIVAADISPQDHALATELATKGLVTWVNFPRLGKARGRYEIPELWLDGQPAQLDHALDIEAEVRREWKENEPSVILSAITRLLARAVAGEIAHRSTEAAMNEGGGVVGLLAGLATTAALTAADRPDTRSWVTLPANVAIARVRVPAGRHTIVVRARGMTKQYRINFKPRSWALAVALALR